VGNNAEIAHQSWISGSWARTPHVFSSHKVSGVVLKGSMQYLGVVPDDP
jgi:hypothetical protein